MYSDHSLDVDATDHILHEILRMETRLDQIDATHEPLLIGLALLQSDVAACFELSEEFPDGHLVDISQLFVD